MSVVNGWQIYFHPLFARRFDQLLAAVAELKQSLSLPRYRQHPTTKLFAGITRLIDVTIPANPDAPDFRLKGNLARFRRAHGHGLPPRYRMFWVFSSSQRAIIFLYLNDESTLHKEGTRSDPYLIFTRLIERGEIGADFATNWEIIETERKRTP